VVSTSTRTDASCCSGCSSYQTDGTCSGCNTRTVNYYDGCGNYTGSGTRTDASCTSGCQAVRDYDRVYANTNVISCYYCSNCYPDTCPSDFCSSSETLTGESLCQQTCTNAGYRYYGLGYFTSFFSSACYDGPEEPSGVWSRNWFGCYCGNP
jgi:hypothetical protein